MDSSSAQQALPVQVRVHLVGGMVMRVEVAGVDPNEVNVEVFDFDVEGVDADQVTVLPDGAEVSIDHPLVEALVVPPR